MKAPLFDIKGKQKGTVDLEATHFGVTPNMGLMHRLLILQQANGRIAIAHAKHRGNARMGDRRSPMRRGGGVVFGPRNEQNWAVSMNKQERRLALYSLLSTKATTESIKVVETFTGVGEKTKTMAGYIKTIEAKKPLFAITTAEKNTLIGANNIPESRIVNVEYLNPHDLLKYSDIIFTESSLAHLYEHFSK